MTSNIEYHVLIREFSFVGFLIIFVDEKSLYNISSFTNDRLTMSSSNISKKFGNSISQILVVVFVTVGLIFGEILC